ncbi:ComF family protein [Fructobacillus papyrifericola]|uniref:ComF family protein n=1 Tax=Fructobacillus papyrifericola TaxID=2713172 RepID=A0ABS5QWA6_9LACO|nr:ComF family protein [Fructobacillus papyrifericola]MBS9336845.1 ComF family protein [Fructobacillus papyrifericola]
MNCLLCAEPLVEEQSLFYLLTGYRPGKGLLCPICLKQFQKIGPVSCPGCGRIQDEWRLCQDCERWKHQGQALLENQALYQYNQQMKDYMARYKFIGDYRLRRVFAQEMRGAVGKKMQEERLDLLVPIPISTERMGSRGFNQVLPLLPKSKRMEELLAVLPGKRIDQSALKRADRLRSRQPFELVEGAKTLLAGRSVLLVDDVYTTGRTLYHAAHLLLEAGATRVCSLTLAR